MSLVLSNQNDKKLKISRAGENALETFLKNLLFGTQGLRAGNAIPRICAATFGTLLMLKNATEIKNTFFNNESYLLFLF